MYINRFQADLSTEVNRPNIVLLKKSTRKCFINCCCGVPFMTDQNSCEEKRKDSTVREIEEN